MTKNTKIEWADHTFNPWIGCTKVGPGCDHCYAEADFDKRRHVVTWGAGQLRKRTAPSTWAQPLRWNAEAERLGIRYRVFCASLADVFDNEVPQLWRQNLMSMIVRTPNLDWMLLTKRIGNAKRMLSDASMHDALLLTANDWYRPPENLWIGATIINQEEADRDIPKLLAVPAAKRFLSMEPLLGPVDLTDITVKHTGGTEDHFSAIFDPDDDEAESFSYIDWVIVGGESGPNARPIHPDWARSLRDQCQAAGVPFMFKQWGEWIPYEDSAQPPFMWSQHGHEIDGHVLPDFESEDGQRQREWHCDYSEMLLARLVGKKAAGRLLDGREWNEVPV
jgi:protein gp37